MTTIGNYRVFAIIGYQTPFLNTAPYRAQINIAPFSKMLAALWQLPTTQSLAAIVTLPDVLKLDITVNLVLNALDTFPIDTLHFRHEINGIA